MAKILRINMTDCISSYENAPPEYMNLGGRGLSAAILTKEVDPVAYPLGKGNKLVIAPGLLTGTPAPSSGRVSVGSKSPLTGGIKESNIGGFIGRTLSRLGIKAIILEGCPSGSKHYVIQVTKEGVEFQDADDIWGLRNYQTVKHIQEHFGLGKRAAVMCIGPAGELQMGSATIATTDGEGHPSRHAGRGGLGAVMGSKGIKALIIDDSGADGSLQTIRDAEGFKRVSKGWAKNIIEQRKALTTYGTAITLEGMNKQGALPTRNYSRGTYEKASSIGGMALAEKIKKNGGKTGHACSPGCVIRCSNIFHDSEGNYVTSGLEYETIALFGSNCEIGDLDAIAEFDYLCDDIGIDTMEMGATMGVLMEAGVLDFGDAKGVKSFLEEVGNATVMGRIIGQGATITGRVFNVERVPTVKGQSMAGYDPRAIKGNGVTYATSAMGADHSAGNCLPARSLKDQKKQDGQIIVSRVIQACSTVLDVMGLCNFTGPVPATMDVIAQLINMANGSDLTGIDLMNLGLEVIRNEKEFNRRAGFTSAQDRLPEFFLREKIDSEELVFDVDETRFTDIFVADITNEELKECFNY